MVPVNSPRSQRLLINSVSVIDVRARQLRDRDHALVVLEHPADFGALMPYLPMPARRIYSIIMKASWLASRRLQRLEHAHQRHAPRCGASLLSRHSNFTQPNGNSPPFRSPMNSLMSGIVIMNATGSPSYSAILIMSSSTIGFSFLPA